MQEASRSSRTLNVALFAAMQPNATSGELIERALWAVRDFSVTPLSEQGIRQGALKDFDVLVVPGGKASVQGSALGSRGRTAIRQFVREGGGYVGICAGAHLAAVNYDWSLKLVNARTISGQRYVPGRGVVSASFRGWGTVSIVGTDKSRGVLGTTARDFRADYTGGPIFIRANRANLPDYVPLAHFHSEVWKYPFQKGTMAGTPAILAAAFGGGRVILFSPHPETATTGEQLLKHAVRAASPAP